MICVAISDKDFNNCLDVLSKVDMAEIRLDLTHFDTDQIRNVFSLQKKLIATHRPNGKSDEERASILKTAVNSGAKYVDIEYEAPDDYRNDIIKFAHKNNCDVIISYHNYEFTPDCEELDEIVRNCFKKGADVAKVATTIKKNVDNSKIFSLYKNPGRLVAFGMGNLGKITRIVAPFLGAEFTFASMEEGLETAPGQIVHTSLRSLIKQIENA